MPSPSLHARAVALLRLVRKDRSDPRRVLGSGEAKNATFSGEFKLQLRPVGDDDKAEEDMHLTTPGRSLHLATKPRITSTPFVCQRPDRALLFFGRGAKSCQGSTSRAFATLVSQSTVGDVVPRSTL